MKKNLLKFGSNFALVFSVLSLTPMIAFAGSCPGTAGTLTAIICYVGDILNTLVPVLILLGVTYFVWGVVRYVIADGEEAKKKGKDIIIYGIIGLTVIVSLWGLVGIVRNTFGLTSNTAPVLGNGAGDSCTAPLTGSDLPAYLKYITCIVNGSIVPLFFAVSSAMFVWGTVKFLLINGGEEKQRTEGKQFMIWGIIALAVMLSIWALVGILGKTFGITSTNVLPQVPKPPAP